MTEDYPKIIKRGKGKEFSRARALVQDSISLQDHLDKSHEQAELMTNNGTILDKRSIKSHSKNQEKSPEIQNSSDLVESERRIMVDLVTTPLPILGNNELLEKYKKPPENPIPASPSIMQTPQATQTDFFLINNLSLPPTAFSLDPIPHTPPSDLINAVISTPLESLPKRERISLITNIGTRIGPTHDAAGVPHEIFVFPNALLAVHPRNGSIGPVTRQ